LIRPEGEEEVEVHKANVLDALKGLEAKRNYTLQLDARRNSIVLCNEV
jgi:hypothetical protein